MLGPGEGATVEPGVVHDWWQVGEEEAQALVEVVPGRRLRRDGRLDVRPGARRQGLAAGMPDPLQLAVMARDYRDVVAFASPPQSSSG